MDYLVIRAQTIVPIIRPVSNLAPPCIPNPEILAKHIKIEARFHSLFVDEIASVQSGVSDHFSRAAPYVLYLAVHEHVVDRGERYAQ